MIIGDGEVAAAEPRDLRHPAPAERVKATPLVRRIAAELGVDLSLLAGTGPDGRITEEDVRRFSAFSGGQTPGLARSDVSPCGASGGRSRST